MREIESLAKRILSDGGATYPEPHPLERYRVSARKDLEYTAPLSKNETWIYIADAITHYLHRLPQGVCDVRGNYLGAWIDGDILYLDVSRAYTSLDTAKMVGRRAKQTAIYDVDSGRVIEL